MKLTEEQRRLNILLYFAKENDQQIFPPAPKRNERRCHQLLAEGLLTEAGISRAWGPLYAITDAGRRALGEQERT